MSWIIDEFSVKPSGIFASWRYKRVLIDINGNLSTSDVPHKEAMNLPCTTDYNKVSRQYKSGDEITRFCNTTTFTEYVVTAIDCDPFAIVTTNADQPQCGYLTPLPTPAVPPNPFGTATYGPYKVFEFLDVDSGTVLVNIYKKGFTGSPTILEAAGDSPVMLRYKNENDNKFNPIRSCECELTFMADANFSLAEFYTEDERAFKVEVFYNGSKKFAGFIIPDSCQEPFNNPPYPVTLIATDSLGALQKVSYPLPIGSSLELSQTFKDILCYALSQTNLGLELHTICNLYEKKMLNGLDNDPLAQATVNPLRFTKGNTVFTCYDVLKAVCTEFGAYIAQIDGAWHFVRINELSNAVIRKRVYNNTGFFLRGENVYNNRTAGDRDHDVKVENGGSIRINNAYKRAVVDLLFGESPALIYNGNFENWDGQNFRYWTKYGGINVSRVQKTITGTGGAQIPINDYAIQFNENANSGKWMQANPVTVYLGDKISFGFTFNVVSGIVVNPSRDPYTFKIRFKIGAYYLWLDSTGKAEWKKELTTAAITQPNNRTTGFAFLPVKLDLPPMPASGQLTIQIFGSDQTSGVYNPVQFDDYSISKSSVDNDEPNGFFYISEQLGFYTEEPETTEILFGDYNQVALPLRPTRDNTGVQFQLAANTLYAISTSDGSQSTVWYEYSQLGAQAPIGQLLARSILKAHQSPFRYYEGEFNGSDLSYLDVFNIEVTGSTFSQKTFAVSSADFDLKRKTMNGTLVEIFSKPIQAIEIATPHQQGDDPPPFTQNPNNPLPLHGNGVFTPEFTPEFI